MPRSIYDVLTQRSNDLHRSLCRVHCRHGVRVSSLGIENGNLRHCALHSGYTIQITRGKKLLFTLIFLRASCTLLE